MGDKKIKTIQEVLDNVVKNFVAKQEKNVRTN